MATGYWKGRSWIGCLRSKRNHSRKWGVATLTHRGSDKESSYRTADAAPRVPPVKSQPADSDAYAGRKLEMREVSYALCDLAPRSPKLTERRSSEPVTGGIDPRAANLSGAVEAGKDGFTPARISELGSGQN